MFEYFPNNYPWSLAVMGALSRGGMISEVDDACRSLREIAALTGHSRNTIRRVVREKAPTPFHTPPRPSRLDPFKDYLRGRFLAHGLSAVRLFAEVRSMGFTGSEVIVRRFIQSLRDSVAAKLTVRFETPPGE